MSDVDDLVKRINAEFAALDDKIKQAQARYVHEYQERQQRLANFEQLLSELPSIWRPRLEALIQHFGDRVKVTPQIASTSRGVTLDFQSNLARIVLRLTASTDADVRQVVLDYNLEIVPIFMQFDSHQQASWPLDAIDRDGIAQWIDDRLVGFVKTYLSLHENECYLKEHMVEDPIAKVRFPKFAAATNLDWNGQTYYFVGNETRREFETQHGLAAK